MAQDKSYRYKQEDGKQTMLLIGVLLVLIVVVGGALVYIITQKGAPSAPPNETGRPPVPPPQNVSNVTNITNVTGQCDDQCLLDRAVQNKNFSDCQGISAEALEQDCYGQLSDVSLDACKALSDQAKRKACVTAFAVADDDIALCELLSEGKDECRLAADPCYNAEDKTMCNVLRDNNPSLCGINSTCLLNYSVTKKNSTSCSLIQNTVAATACLSAVQYTDKCSDLSMQAEKDYCYQLFAVYANDYLTCTQITTNSAYALECYSVFAARLHNLSVCDRGGFGLNERWACYTNYSLATGDLSGCEEIDELATTNQFRCSFEYAKKYGNPAACQIIGSLASRSTCYEGAIIYSNQNLDWHFCDDVTSFDWRNKCYTESAKLYDDVSLCDNIAEDFAKESCRNSYAVNKAK
jgi:hypothetical protein